MARWGSYFYYRRCPIGNVGSFSFISLSPSCANGCQTYWTRLWRQQLQDYEAPCFVCNWTFFLVAEATRSFFLEAAFDHCHKCLFFPPSLHLLALCNSHYGQRFIRSCVHCRLLVHLWALPHHPEVRDATCLSTQPEPRWDVILRPSTSTQQGVLLSRLQDWCLPWV